MHRRRIIPPLLAAATAALITLSAGQALADTSTTPSTGTSTTQSPVPTVTTDDSNWGG